MNKIKLCGIVAMSQNNVIGNDNQLIWHISEDLKHFKRTTLGKPIIMGRKSYESIGKPLPGRKNIVISRSGQLQPNKDSAKPDKLGGDSAKAGTLHLVTSIEAGIALGHEFGAANHLNEIFITGGGEIYKQTLDQLDRLYLTIVHKDYKGDTWFPDIKWEEWTIASEETFEGDPSFTIYVLDRI